MQRIADLFVQLYTSPEFFRMTIASILFCYTFILRKHYPLPFKNGLLAVPIILFGREVVALFINSPPVYLLSDVSIVVLYAFFLPNYNVKRLNVIILAAISAVSLTITTMLYVLFPDTSSPVFFSNILIIGILIYFAVLMQSISMNNAPNAIFIIKNRGKLFMTLLITRIVILFSGNDMRVPIIQDLILPLSYIPYFFLIVQFHLQFHAQSNERENFANQYLNSLFDFMRTIGSAMTERIEVKSVLNYVIKNLVKFSGAEAGVVLLRDGNDNSLKLEIMDGFFPPPFPIPQIVKSKLLGVQRMFESTPIKMGETVFGVVAAENRSIHIRNTLDSPLMEANVKDDTLFINTIIAIPLIVNKEVFGVVAICGRRKHIYFSELDFERAKIFAEFASLTLDSLYSYAQLLEKQEIEREVSIAATIQKKLLPGRMPKAIQSMVAAYSKPAKGVSGDYYDIIPLTKAGKFALVICDVAGKGVPASLIMVMIRTIVHLIAGSVKDAGMVVNWINRGIAGAIDIERFATLSYVVYDPTSHTLEYSNAGHHPAWHHRVKTGEITRIDSPGLPVGLERDTNYQRVRIKLESEDVIMFYTDGIIESLNPQGEQYEEERLKTVFKDNLHKKPKEILDSINEDIDRFVSGGKQHDDMTLIVFKAH
jgi:sigma-B regulation protein RsbU (phosphoserine phosphatase)